MNSVFFFLSCFFHTLHIDLLAQRIVWTAFAWWTIATLRDDMKRKVQRVNELRWFRRQTSTYRLKPDNIYSTTDARQFITQQCAITLNNTSRLMPTELRSFHFVALLPCDLLLFLHAQIAVCMCGWDANELLFRLHQINCLDFKSF